MNLNTETLNLNIDTNENDKTTKSTENQNKDIEEPNKIKTQIIEEESYKTDKQNIIEIKDSIDNVNLSLNNAEWSNNGQNDVNFVISFDSSSSKYTLFRNPVIKIDLPSEIEKVILGDSTLLYGNGLSLSNITTKENENGSISILATLEGSQTHYEETPVYASLTFMCYLPRFDFFSGFTPSWVGTTGLMVPSALNSMRSMHTSRCTPGWCLM